MGIVGVIGSLVFVGLEMRQSQRIALVNQIQQRSYTVQASISAFTEANKDWFSAQFPALPTKNLSEVEKDIRNVLNQAWFAYEADFNKLIGGISKGKSIEIPYVADCYDFSYRFSLIVHFVPKVEVYFFAVRPIFSHSIPFFPLKCLCVEKNGSD